MELNPLGYECSYSVDFGPDGANLTCDFEFGRRDVDMRSSTATSSHRDYRSSFGLFLRVSHQGQGWTGSFEPGAEGITETFATPSDSVVCIVCRGQGYLVPVNAPENYTIIPIDPIRRVYAVPNENMMIFIDYTKVFGFGRCGLNWMTDDISWDGIEICGFENGAILGKGWDAPDNQEVAFSIDTRSGHVIRGTSPDKRGGYL